MKKLQTKLLITFIVTILLSLGAPVYAQTQNTYRIINEAVSWKEAKRRCEELGGHLATITSKEEETKILSILGTNPRNCYWIGLYRSSASSPWRWVTNETYSYKNWAPNEPNDDKKTNEKYVHIFGRKYTGGSGIKNPGQWNDATNTGAGYEFYKLKNFGYICEWENHKHTWKTTTTKKATCTKTGSKTYTCTVCKAKKTTKLAAVGHKYGAWKITKKATIEEKGKKSRTCSVCKKTETKAIAKLTPTTRYSKAKQTYTSWLSNNAEKYEYYDIVDVDKNGIPELLCCGYGTGRVYTCNYSGKKMVLLKSFSLGRSMPNAEIILYNTSKKMIEYVEWDTRETRRYFCKINGTKISTYKTYQFSDACKINGKICSIATYQRNLNKDLKNYKALRYKK